MEVDSTATTATTICSQCGLIDHKILHNVRLNGTFRRLCTTCVLRLHRTSYCPSCLVVYHPSPPENAIFCYRCHSSSHRTCVSPSVTGRTPCATCLNPNRLVFNPKSPDCCDSNRRIDVTAARLLVAAAEISLASMSKAEEDSIMEVDWRVTEAADWRKKAKEAVNRFVKLTEIVKKRRDDNSGIDDIEVSEDLNAVNLDGESIFRMMEI